MVTTWEYRQLITGTKPDPDMADLGRKGWELVAIIPSPGSALIAYFKRPLPGPDPL